MINLTITAENPDDLMRQMKDVLAGAWGSNPQTRESALEGARLEVAIQAAEKTAEKDEAEPAPAPEPLAKPEDLVPTEAELREAIRGAMDRVGKDEVKAVLSEFADKLRDVPEERRAELWVRMTELGA